MRAILTGLVLSLACLALLSVGRADASSVDLRDTPTQASVAAIDTLQTPFA